MCRREEYRIEKYQKIRHFSIGASEWRILVSCGNHLVGHDCSVELINHIGSQLIVHSSENECEMV